MFTDFSTSAYATDGKNKLIGQIVSVYNANPNATIPTNDQQTLTYLSMRKQCIEP
jgi:exopolysaccharide biosynthesis predicted pyruvyltransferase EpsI